MSSNGNSLVPALPGPPPLPGALPGTQYPGAGIDHAAVGDGSEQPTPLKKVHQLLRGRYHWAVLLALLIGVAGGVGGFFLKKPAFESVGVVRVNPVKTRILYQTEDNKVPANWTSVISVEMRALKDDRVILRALDKPAIKEVALSADMATVNNIAELMTVKREGGEMIRIGYEDHDPKLASAIVRSVVASYMELYGEREKQQQEELMRLLEDRRLRLTAELNALRERQFALANENGFDINEQFRVSQQRVYDLQTQIQQVENELAERGVSADDTVVPKDIGSMTLEEMAEKDPGVLGELVARRRDLEAQREVLTIGRRLGSEHREVRVVQQMIDIINSRIAERRQQLIDGNVGGSPGAAEQIGPLSPFNYKFRTTDELRRLLSKLKQDENTARQALLETSKKKNALDLLHEEVDTTSRRLGEVRLRITQLEVERSSGEDRVTVLSEGTMPTKPSNGGKRKQLAALGGMAGASLGVTIILLIGLADPRLRTIDDARTGLHQARMLGILPSLPEDLADPQQASIAAHCVHHIRTMLQVGVSPDQHRVYSVTSPGAGTGKTSLTLALGLSFAASDSKTLLIDCDLVGGGLTRRVAAVVRRRIGHLLQKHGLVTNAQIEEALQYAQQHQTRLGEALIELAYIKSAELDRVLNLQEQSLLGVMDACNGEQFEHCIAETGVKNLSILPTGTAMARHAASLSPSAVNRLVAEARSKFDIVLIDTGPILGSLEASVVAGTVDGTVLIVSRGDHRAICDKSVEYLQSIRANLMGIVFNRAEVHDFERSSFTSLASMSSLRPNDGEVVEGEVIDGEASSRLGPVGSAVVSNSRIARNGKGHRA